MAVSKTLDSTSKHTDKGSKNLLQQPVSIPLHVEDPVVTIAPSDKLSRPTTSTSLVSHLDRLERVRLSKILPNLAGFPFSPRITDKVRAAQDVFDQISVPAELV